MFGYIGTQPWKYVSTFSDGLLSRDLGMAVNGYSWRKDIDNGLVVGAAFVDFQKAFDCVSYAIIKY